MARLFKVILFSRDFGNYGCRKCAKFFFLLIYMGVFVWLQSWNVRPFLSYHIEWYWRDWNSITNRITRTFLLFTVKYTVLNVHLFNTEIFMYFRRQFKTPHEVYLHVCEAHCPTGGEEILCLWASCDALKRRRFSLMTHLYDRHCNAEVSTIVNRLYWYNPSLFISMKLMANKQFILDNVDEEETVDGNGEDRSFHIDSPDSPSPWICTKRSIPRY